MTAVASRTPMSARRLATGWAGVAFFVLFPLGTIFSSNSLEADDSDKKWQDWFADSGNRTGNIIGIYALVLASIAFIVFASGLLERFRTTEGPSLPHRIAATTGTVFAVLTVVGAIQLGGVSGNISFGDTPVPKDADIMRQTLGYGTLAVGGALMAAAFMIAVALQARATFPQWLIVLTYVFAVILLGAVFFLPLAALPIWVLIVSIVVLTRGAPAAVPAAAPAV
ncbi:MAG TPA: hypothetical protein VJ831_02950 [Jatrophihabitantaceae bacterium]|nr:hypothetical protein [Jatrophihabitantaceae bacterium]